MPVELTLTDDSPRLTLIMVRSGSDVNEGVDRDGWTRIRVALIRGEWRGLIEQESANDGGQLFWLRNVDVMACVRKIKFFKSWNRLPVLRMFIPGDEVILAIESDSRHA
jgi:hypothetical protein